MPAPYAPLSGITVIETARPISAAYCGRILADLGAQVFRCADLASTPGEDVHDPTSDELAAWLHHGKLPLLPGTSIEADLLMCD
jgi:crotonobetainyl-CoA:carnitine CoA-transferase CaiB-like acyl-CoA transferase